MASIKGEKKRRRIFRYAYLRGNVRLGGIRERVYAPACRERSDADAGFRVIRVHDESLSFRENMRPRRFTNVFIRPTWDGPRILKTATASYFLGRFAARILRRVIRLKTKTERRIDRLG